MNPPMLVGSLCSGYGGLELGLELVTPAEPRWFAEIDPYAAKILAHHWPDAPNHGDLNTTVWSQVEPVDVITAGWPCQPWSQAGKRKGSDDERAIWPAVAEALRVVRPRHVFLENVPAIASAGELERVTASLAALGYVGSWRCLRAADVGAPHRRERIFIVAAHPGRRAVQRRPVGRGLPGAEGQGEGEGLQRERRRRRVGDGGAAAPDPGVSGPQGPTGTGTTARRADNPGGGAATGRGGAAPDPEGDGRDTRRPEPTGPQGRPDAALGGDAAADPDGEGRGRGPQRHLQSVGPELEASLGADADGRVLDWGQYGNAIARWESHTGEPAPAPTVLGPRGALRLNARFVEWLMGLEAGWVCDVPGITRNQMLKALGNGVVPQQAAAAWRALSAINPLKETA